VFEHMAKPVKLLTLMTVAKKSAGSLSAVPRSATVSLRNLAPTI